MASHIEGLGFPGHTTPLLTRLQDGFARLVEALKSRDDIRGSLPLAAGERVVATTCDSSGRWVAASERALYHHVDARSGSVLARKWVRVGWEEVSSVTWKERGRTLTLTGLVPTVARRTVLHLPSGTSIALLAQERVSWSAVVRTEIRLGEHGTARVIGRRRPGSDEFTWLVGLDSGSDVAAAQPEIAAALGELRAQWGI